MSSAPTLTVRTVIQSGGATISIKGPIFSWSERKWKSLTTPITGEGPRLKTGMAIVRPTGSDQPSWRAASSLSITAAVASPGWSLEKLRPAAISNP